MKMEKNSKFNSAFNLSDFHEYEPILMGNITEKPVAAIFESTKKKTFSESSQHSFGSRRGSQADSYGFTEPTIKKNRDED